MGKLVVSTIETQSIKYDANTTALSIHSTGTVTNSYRPMWLVDGAITKVTNGSADLIVTMANIKYNIGSHYDNSTGKFTAPLDGYYGMYCHMLQNSPGTYVLWNFFKNGSNYTSAWRQNYEPTGTYTDTVGSVVMQMSAGDTAHVELHPSYNSLYPNGYCDMGGYLLG